MLETLIERDELQTAVENSKLEDAVIEWLLDDEYTTYEELLADHMGNIDDPDIYLELGRVLREAMVVDQESLTLDPEDIGEEPFFFHGHLTVEGNLEIASAFVVTGHLHVTGIISDMGPDSMVIVMGDVVTAGLYTTGEFHVQGSIVAKDGIVYGAYNDNILEATTIQARLVVEDDHYIDAVVDAKYHFDLETMNDHDASFGPLHELLISEVFDRNGYLNTERLFELLAQGRRVFRQ